MAVDPGQWLVGARWSDGHEAAFAALDARSRTENSDRLAFAEAWPDGAIVDAWIEAVLVDSALACTSGRVPRLEGVHARALVVQARRGFGWGNTEHRDPVRARASLIAALVGDWDLVAKGLGGRPLSRSVGKSSAFSSLGGLVRHVATAAKNGLGEGSCADALRTYATSSDCELPVLWALARLAIEIAGGHPRSEVPARFAAILGGAEGTTRARVPVVDDPRVSVFERYMAMGSAEERAEVEQWLVYVRDERALAGWDASVAESVAHASVLGMDELLATVLPRLVALRTGSSSYPTPAVPFLAMLGRPVLDGESLLRADLKKFHRARELSTLRRYKWSTAAAAVALAADDLGLVKKLTPASGKDVFRPGKAFGDDPRAVLRHYALAIEANASLADVTPAWLELLVTRPPDRDDGRTGGRWGWDSLWCLAFAHFHRIGGAAPHDVPGLLRNTLRGVDA